MPPPDYLAQSRHGDAHGAVSGADMVLKAKDRITVIDRATNKTRADSRDSEFWPTTFPALGIRGAPAV